MLPRPAIYSKIDNILQFLADESRSYTKADSFAFVQGNLPISKKVPVFKQVGFVKNYSSRIVNQLCCVPWPPLRHRTAYILNIYKCHNHIIAMSPFPFSNEKSLRKSYFIFIHIFMFGDIFGHFLKLKFWNNFFQYIYVNV